MWIVATTRNMEEDRYQTEKMKIQRQRFIAKEFLPTERINDIQNELNPYLTWREKDSLGRLIPRAQRHRKIIDEEYLDKIQERDNMQYLYAQNFSDKDEE